MSHLPQWLQTILLSLGALGVLVLLIMLAYQIIFYPSPATRVACGIFLVAYLGLAGVLGIRALREKTEGDQSGKD